MRGTPGTSSDGVLAMLLALVDQLRRAGVAVSMVEVIDATAALGHVELVDRPVLRAGLAGTLVKRPEDLPLFQLAFDRCFPLTPPDERATTRQPADETGDGPASSVPDLLPVEPSTELLGALLAALRDDDSETLAAMAALAVDRHAGIGTVEGSERYFLYRVLRALDVANLLAAAMRAERAEHPGASALELRLRRDEHAARIDELRRLIAREVRRRLARLGDEAGVLAPIPHRLADLDVLRASTTDLRELRAAVRPLARKLASRVAQRRRRHHLGRLDMRRTMRHSLTTGGVPMDPAYRRRKLSKPNVVVLCDLSGSVAEFAQFTLALVHALDAELAGLRSFVFVDGVAEVTDLLDRADDVLEPLLDAPRRTSRHARHHAHRRRRRPHELPAGRRRTLPPSLGAGAAHLLAQSRAASRLGLRGLRHRRLRPVVHRRLRGPHAAATGRRRRRDRLAARGLACSRRDAFARPRWISVTSAADKLQTTFRGTRPR